MSVEDLFYPALRGLIRKWGLIHESERLELTTPLAVTEEGDFVEYVLPYSSLQTIEDIVAADKALEKYSQPGLLW